MSAPDSPAAPDVPASAGETTEARAEPVPACPNCGSPHLRDYCAACGQRNEVLRQPIHHFLGESLVEYFGVDGRLWRTLGLLLFRPGRLTQAYLDGRRIAYLRPLRIYLTATLLFFFLLSVLDPVGTLERRMGMPAATDTTMRVDDRLAEVEAAMGEHAAEVEMRERVLDSLNVALDSVRVLTASDSSEALIEALDDLAALSEDEAEDLDRLLARTHRLDRLEWQRGVLQGWPPDSVIRPADLDEAAVLLFSAPETGSFTVGLPAWVPQSNTVERMRSARTTRDRAAAAGDYARDMLAQLPTVMFLLLPVFALLLKVIYGNQRWRSFTWPVRSGWARLLRRPLPASPPAKWYYSEHLVFALHTHAFAFLVFALITAFVGFSGGAVWTQVAAQLLVLVVPVYFFVAQKRVYAQGWVKTAVKALILAWLYGWLLLGLGMTLALMLAAIG